MADLTVDNDTSLGPFLRKNKYQQWRIPILVNRGAVKAFRGSGTVPLKDEKTTLRSGDVVRIVDPVPKPYQQALQDEANKNSRDYAFVPGKTPFDVTMGKLNEARPETIRINDPLIDNLAAFLHALEKSASITNPIRNLIVASHANPEGLLFMSIDILGARTITYEDLEAALKSKSIVLDNALLAPRPTAADGATISAQLLFRGCRIGSQPEFMRKLKEAMGNKIQVVAPKHFHIVAQFTVPPGYVEYMGYNFTVNKPKQLKDKKAVVGAFLAAKLTLIDGNPVPQKLWDAWIPDKPNLPGKNEYPNTVVIPITKHKGPALREFRYKHRSLLETPGSFALLDDKGKKQDRKDALKQELTKLDRYKDTHPFPEFKRYGYKTMDEFMDGWDWDFKYDKSSKTLFYNGSRHEYTLIQPIVEVKTGELVLNFYPTTKKGSVLELLKPSDTRFFASF